MTEKEIQKEVDKQKNEVESATWKIREYITIKDPKNTEVELMVFNKDYGKGFYVYNSFFQRDTV